MHPVTFHDTKRQSLTLWTSREVYREEAVQASLRLMRLESRGSRASFTGMKACSHPSMMADNDQISHLSGFRGAWTPFQPMFRAGKNFQLISTFPRGSLSHVMSFHPLG